MIELDIMVPQKVKARSVTVHAKVCDSGSYELRDADGNKLAERDDYVPGFFPGEHFGDYLDLEIDLETGKILNWKTPTGEQIVEAFKIKANVD